MRQAFKNNNETKIKTKMNLVNVQVDINIWVQNLDNDENTDANYNL